MIIIELAFMLIQALMILIGVYIALYVAMFALGCMPFIWTGMVLMIFLKGVIR